MASEHPIASTSATPMTLMDYTKATAPFNVIKGTATFTALGALTGSTMGVIKNIPALPAAFSTGVNTGLYSFSFFALREYLVIPLLTLQNLHPNPLLSTSSQNPHFHNLLPTALSSITSGVFFSYFSRKTFKGSFRAGTTLGLNCTLLQGVINEVGLVRVKWLLSNEENQRRRNSFSNNDSEGSQLGERKLSMEEKYKSTTVANDPKQETFADRSDRLFGEAWKKIKTKVGDWSPVQRMDEKEYEEKMNRRLERIEMERERMREERRRLEERLERKLREENAGAEGR